MWSPSSLIFLVLLGVWAAYFLQYWIRRRDHLATARSVEQFSEAMRVLERRDTTPRTDLSEPAPRSWDVRPGVASARPQVLVKRAVPAEPARPVVSERVESRPDRAEPVRGRPAASASPRWGAPRTDEDAPTKTPPPTERRRGARRRPTGRPGEAPLPRRVRPGRRVRAVLMLLALAGVVAVSALVVLGMLQLWAIAPAAVGLVVAFAYVRSGVRAERALRAARRRRRAEQRRRSDPSRTEHRDRPGSATSSATGRAATGAGGARDGVADDSPVRAVEPAADGEHQEPAETSPSAAGALDQPAAASTDGPASSAVPAVDAEEGSPEHVDEVEYVHLVDEDDIPLTWDPVPVPRPTYTMKARAERPEVSPAEVTPEPEPHAVAPADDSLEERRVAGA